MPVKGHETLRLHETIYIRPWISCVICFISTRKLVTSKKYISYQISCAYKRNLVVLIKKRQQYDANALYQSFVSLYKHSYNNTIALPTVTNISTSLYVITSQLMATFKECRRDVIYWCVGFWWRIIIFVLAVNSLLWVEMFITVASLINKTKRRNTDF